MRCFHGRRQSTISSTISPRRVASVGEKPLFLRRAPLLAFRAMTTANTTDKTGWRGATRTAVMSGDGLQTRPRARAKYTGIVLDDPRRRIASGGVFHLHHAF